MINLGDVNFNLGADTRSLQQSVNLMRQFGQVVDQVQTQTTQSANATAAAFRKQEAAITSALNQTLRLSSSMRKVKDGEQYAQQTARAFEQLNRTMTSGQLSALHYQRAMEQFRASQANTTRAFKDFSTATQNAAGKGQYFANAMRGLQSSFVLVQGPLGGIATRISTVTSLVGAAGTGFAAFTLGVAATGYAVYKLGSIILDAGVKINKLNAQLLAVSGSQTIASDQMAKLFKIARQTGQSIDDLAPSFAKFEMAAKGAGLSTNEMFKEFTMLATAATKLQLSGEESQGMFRALEQMLSKGTVQAEELRGQLGDRLAGAFNIAAKAMGVTTAELGKMMKSGEVLSNDFLPKFIDQLGIALHIDLSKPIDNYAASVNNLSTSWTQFLVKMDSVFGVTEKVMQVNKENTAIIDSWTASIDGLVESVKNVGYFWQAMVNDINSSSQGLQSNSKNLWDTMTEYAKKSFEATNQASAMSWAEQLHNEIATMNKMLDFMVNGADALATGLKGMSDILANYVIDAMNVMIRKIEEGLNALFAIIRNRTDDISRLFPSMKDILPYPKDFDTTQDAIPKGLVKSWSELGAEITKTMKIQHGFLDSTEEKIKQWMDDAQVLKYFGTGSGGPQRRFANNMHANDDVSAPQAEVEMTDKQTKALERKLQAQQNIEDAIANTQEKLDALGGTEANLNSLTDAFKREKEVKKYGDALRKAGADTQYIAEKTALLNKLLAETDVAEKQREALLELRDSFVQGFDDISQSILSAFENGKNAAQAFKDTIKKVVNDIIDTFLRLAILNPFKNWLFGTDLPTMGGAGGLGIGNAIKQSLPGIFGSSKSTGAGLGGMAASTMVPMNTSGSSIMSVMTQAIPANDNTIGGTMSSFAQAIKQIESGSFAGNYSAIGNLTDKGDRAYGAYQVMGANIPSWTKSAVGQSLTPQEFLRNPGAQDAVFNQQFGNSISKLGSAQQAASVWFTGQPMSQRSGSSMDVNGTTGNSYVNQFNDNMKKLGTTVGNVQQPVAGLGQASNAATNGVSQFGNALSQFPAAPGGGGSSLWGSLFGGGGMAFASAMSPLAAADIASGSWGLFAKGDVFSGGRPQRFALGDVFGSPTTFPMAGGGSGMLGEAGEEAIMPLTRHSDGKLGVRAANSNGSRVNVTVINNAGVSVSTSKRHNTDGTIDIVAQIDQTVADRLSRRGTDSSNALRKTYQAKQVLKGR